MRVRPEQISRETREAQARAANPEISVWVSANAGSGKTHVLTDRVVRLLLDGVPPEGILCVTYTRTAAANMASKVFERLSGWTEASDDVLASEVAALTARPVTAAILLRARRLFATALETPGGLKIQTIHAFCEALLHQFPLEAGIAGHFTLMDDLATRRLSDGLVQTFLTPGSGTWAGVTDPVIRRMIARQGESKLDALFTEIAARRDELRAFIESLRGNAVAPATAFPALYAMYGFAGETRESIASGVWPLDGFEKADLDELQAEAISHGAANALKLAESLSAAFMATDAFGRFEAICSAFLTAKGEARKTGGLFKAPMNTPERLEWFERMAAGVEFARLRLADFDTLSSTEDALVLADHYIAAYEKEKQRTGLLDFNDLVERVATMLSNRSIAPWVRYKMDRGIEHILVDEAQDTSPRQWDVITPLAEEFFAGRGAVEKNRTVFAVGDEKQSIYSFQGARPDTFDEKRRHFDRAASGARDPQTGLPEFATVRLQTSFRSTPDILQAVDAVFSREEARRGIDAASEPTVHTALAGMGEGEVRLWDMIVAVADAEEEDWTKEIDSSSVPEVRLAAQITSVVRRWLDPANPEMLRNRNRPMRAGDIMVLVRNRGAFIHELSRRMKEAGLPVAGTDKMVLTDHIAVQDLIALGNVLIQPADDLSLAALLRSPVFDLSEDDLRHVAAARPEAETLAAALARQGASRPDLAAIDERLGTWRREAASIPVFDFYAGILARDGLRARFLERFGREVDDILSEFLNFVRLEEEAGRASLPAFLASAAGQEPSVKREFEQDSDEIRIMTVHGAKGLEAPVVFLVDPGTAPLTANHQPALAPVPPSGSRKGGWVWYGAAENGVLKAEAKAAFEDVAMAEYRRLLYVGMTRAEERLVVCGHATKTYDAAKSQTWHALVSRALADLSTERRDPAGFDYLHFSPSGAGAGRSDADETATIVEETRPPSWWGSKVLPREPGLPRPLSPSGASVLIEEGIGEEPVAPGLSPVFSGTDGAPSLAARRGTAVHRLLEVLPSLDPAERRQAGENWLAHAFADGGPADAARLLDEVMAILGDPRLEALFGPGSRAEVAIMGKLVIRGRERAVSGVIDRLAVTETEILLADYKTTRPPPGDHAAIPPSHLAQMALYRALVRQIWPGRTVRTCLVYSAAPAVFEPADSVLEAALAAVTGT